jgi:hypothetical protein
MEYKITYLIWSAKHELTFGTAVSLFYRCPSARVNISISDLEINAALPLTSLQAAISRVLHIQTTFTCNINGVK